MTKFDLTKATDGELLALFEQGRDQSAFAELVRRHGQMVLGVALRNLDSRQDAEDAFQATFFALARAVERLRDRERVSAWLHGTARKTASSIRRRGERHRHRLQLMKERAREVKTEPSIDPAEITANDEFVKVLDEEIDRISEKTRPGWNSERMYILHQRQRQAHRLPTKPYRYANQPNLLRLCMLSSVCN